jgi:hypothetical protein
MKTKILNVSRMSTRGQMIACGIDMECVTLPSRTRSLISFLKCPLAFESVGFGALTCECGLGKVRGAVLVLSAVQFHQHRNIVT